MKKIFGLILSLTAISGVCAAVLAYVDSVTKAPIADMKVREEQQAVRAVMPPGVAAIEKADGFFVGRDAGGKTLGYACAGRDAGGYGGDIALMVGFEADRKTLVCYKTLSASETPGLGMKLNAPEFADQFRGREASPSLAVKKDGGAIEAITSATITSRAVCRAIADAQKRLR